MVIDNDAKKLTLLERSAEKEAVAVKQQGGEKREDADNTADQRSERGICVR
jgi:hypothetical protein